MKYSDIPKFTRVASYRIDVGWDYLQEWLDSQMNKYKDLASLDLDPDFQRGHVWSKEQQIRYVEFILRGGRSSRTLYFNCAGWQRDYRGPFVLVDGKQRLNAVIQFLENKLPVFENHLLSQFEDKNLCWKAQANFSVEVNDLNTRKEVLQWYLDLNTGGVVHTSEEIEKVRKMLKEEK